MYVDNLRTIWPISLKEIEETVAAHLRPGRVSGNAAGPCFSRQVSMYLAKNMGGWSLSSIGRFYNGRHHTTVLHAISKIEQLRKTDDALDALIDVLTVTLASEVRDIRQFGMKCRSRSEFIDEVAARVIEKMRETKRETAPILD